MLRLNEKLMYIKCSTYEYLVKKGSISNYSYNIIDEKKLGVLETLFHHETYPIHKEQLLNRLGKNMSGDQKNELESIIEEFLELDILVEEKERLSQKAAILTKSHYTEIINERFKEMGFSCCFILSRDEVNPSGTTPVENVLFVDDYNDESLEKLLSGFDIIIVIWDHYSPSLFRKINSLCLSIRKPLAISYFDGDEGIFVPLLNMAESACFNDFEILRESSFYNLLDYQTMKEYLIKNPIKNSCVGKIYFETLINHTAILLNRMLSYKSLNAFAYSFDFERMVLSKTRLLKFPKCPACQGDKNIKHPFI